MRTLVQSPLGVFTVAAIGGPHSIGIVRKSWSAVIEPGNTQPQRHLRSANVNQPALAALAFAFTASKWAFALSMHAF
jgi:hypothetical protein